MLLMQKSEFHGMDDAIYIDWFHVGSRDEAVILNEKYDGYEIEKQSDIPHIFLIF